MHWVCQYALSGGEQFDSVRDAKFSENLDDSARSAAVQKRPLLSGQLIEFLPPLRLHC